MLLSLSVELPGMPLYLDGDDACKIPLTVPTEMVQGHTHVDVLAAV